ncbi:transcription activator GAGA-like [Hetaerina americana]|uniref:transcription activator GAGA-like n=1 Tax=Hetaerina americana TaxID=62018 RepID=UPI003A7F1C03
MSVGEDDAEQFSLRWNNFHNNLTLGFHELLEEEDLVDVTLACDGKYVQAHKIVLSVCSPYFKSLFKENPCRHPIVILKDVGHKELQAILQFMYRGEVNVRQDDLTGFLKTAEMLKIKGLTGENSDKDSQKRTLSEEKRRPRSGPSHCDDSGSVPYKKVKSEQRRYRVVPRPSSRPHSPIECIPPSSASRDEIMHSGFDVTKPKEEPVDYSQVEDEYSSELAPSLPHEIEEGMEDMEGECTSGGEGVVSEARGGMGSGRNHLPADGGQGDPQPTSALAAMAHLVHVGGPSSSEGGQRQDSLGLEAKQMPTIGLPPVGSGAVLEPNVALQVDSKERLQGIFPGSSGLSQDSSSSQDISQVDTKHLVYWAADRQVSLKCSLCPRVFVSKTNLQVHMKNEHGDDRGPFNCSICGRQSKNKNSLRVHVYLYHKKKKEANQGDGS